MNKAKWIVKCVLGGVVILLLVGLVTMLLWNWLLPAIFGMPEITFIQALGVLLLAKILFGGWGGGGCRAGGGPSWKHRYHEKLAAMTPEERERFKARMREKWRCRPTEARENFPASSND